MPVSDEPAPELPLPFADAAGRGVLDGVPDTTPRGAGPAAGLLPVSTPAALAISPAVKPVDVVFSPRFHGGTTWPRSTFWSSGVLTSGSSLDG
ncbi:hypothetical protein [Gordonia liuliyuniae]|uniref:Uncharacterized protein n=1 Tax=Gordonia liuliyuniae TaxID=2911517 RepID=A0ABS9IU41_9ACTN|nr:hypothetical protein [Gordonia liuliyuniae]MCF8589085.1 hypothetical protein [Gordonia liuliyuniae]